MSFELSPKFNELGVDVEIHVVAPTKVFNKILQKIYKKFPIETNCYEVNKNYRSCQIAVSCYCESKIMQLL